MKTGLVMRRERYLIASYVLILLGTAVLKIGKVLSGNPKLFFQWDPVFTFLTVREVLLMVVLLEIWAVVALCMRKTFVVKCGIVALISSLFLAYRLSLWVRYDTKAHCNCLGLLQDWEALPSVVSESISYMLLLYLLITAYAGMLGRFKNAPVIEVDRA